jgi:hypothetical protein
VRASKLISRLQISNNKFAGGRLCLYKTAAANPCFRRSAAENAFGLSRLLFATFMSIYRLFGQYRFTFENSMNCSDSRNTFLPFLVRRKYLYTNKIRNHGVIVGICRSCLLCRWQTAQVTIFTKKQELIG